MATETKTRRRGNGEGSIFQMKDGRWVAQVTFVDATGARKIKRKVAQTQNAARRKLTKMKGDQDSFRLVVSGRATVRAWLDVWLEQFVKPNRAPKTHDGYTQTLKHYVPARLGSMPLDRITAEHLQQLFNDIGSAHPRTAVLLRAILRSSFNKAVKLGRMPNNPVLGTDPVKYAPEETATFTLDEGLRFLEVAKDDRLGALFTIMLSLGLREGEGAGLKASDIDFDGRILYVRRSLQWNKTGAERGEGRWIERPPKANSKRDLPMTETIYRSIVRHMALRQEEAATTKGWTDSGYLFTSATGAPLHASNILQAFHALCDAAGVRRIRVHDARHSCGTLLHAQGADPFTIQKVLGHSQLTTTRRYTHVPIEVTRTAVNGLESAFETARAKQQKRETETAVNTPPTPSTTVQ